MGASLLALAKSIYYIEIRGVSSRLSRQNTKRSCPFPVPHYLRVGHVVIHGKDKERNN